MQICLEYNLSRGKIMIEYLDIINKIKNIKLDAITYFNDKVSIPLVLANLDSLIKYDNKSIFIEKNNKKVELTEIDRKSYFEILYLLKNIESGLYSKIDFKYIDFFEKFKLSNTEYTDNISLDKLNDETLKILSILNIKFWCENDEIKKEFLENMNPKKDSSILIKKELEEDLKQEENEVKNNKLVKTNWWIRLLNKIRKMKEER